MTTTQAIPIPQNWTTPEVSEGSTTAAAAATASDVNALLAQLAVPTIGTSLLPLMAAAAAELALVAGIPWRFSVDDAPVALLRLIAKVAITAPLSSGPHTGRLHALLATGLAD